MPDAVTEIEEEEDSVGVSETVGESEAPIDFVLVTEDVPEGDSEIERLSEEEGE